MKSSCTTLQNLYSGSFITASPLLKCIIFLDLASIDHYAFIVT